ncbi:MAG: hypothetical protein Nkreftii_000053 [Candidatus Nitrospira kreftii]|uniref:Uncharacterized protein n=1 Tax=Candidatus Nitrospira kreftii TaxID=2652173 RepID=A0A7S8IXQ0_9BACT|nr:MAG: hypothetical protein Nkreftii_000053 [Candidatus Nitrospira kreftii]
MDVAGESGKGLARYEDKLFNQQAIAQQDTRLKPKQNHWYMEVKMKRPGVLFLLALLIVSFVANGCTNARVRYDSIPADSQDLKGKHKFRLSRSLILIEPRVIDPKDRNSPVGLFASSVPSDSIFSNGSAQVFSLEEVSDFFSETKLNISKIDNTDLISEVGVEVKDKLNENLEKAGAVLGTVLKVALAAAAAENPTRTVIDVKEYTAAKQEWQDLPLNSGWVYKIALSPLPKPPGALKTTDFFADPPTGVKGVSVNVFPMSACFDATLYLYRGQKGPESKTDWDNVRPFQMKIADPDYVQTLALPSKGKIKMHSSCGASVISETKEGAHPAYGIIETVIKQAEAIKKAIDDRKKNN